MLPPPSQQTHSIHRMTHSPDMLCTIVPWDKAHLFSYEHGSKRRKWIFCCPSVCIYFKVDIHISKIIYIIQNQHLLHVLLLATQCQETNWKTYFHKFHKNQWPNETMSIEVQVVAKLSSWTGKYLIYWWWEPRWIVQFVLG